MTPIRSLAIGTLATISLLVAGLIPAIPAEAAAMAAPPATGTTFPSNPPAAICGSASVLNGPSLPPLGAIPVLAGDNSLITWNLPGATFWFAPGTHTLGGSPSSQIAAAPNTTFLGAPGAVIDGQGINVAAFTTTASGVTVRYLTIQGFVAPRNEGVVNHDVGANWTVQYNTVTNNTGAGVMVGPGNVISYNCLKSNGQYGFSAYKAGGDSNITVDHNEIAANNTSNWEVVLPGCGCVGGGKLWNTVGATITNNWVHNNIGPGIWVDTNNAGILIDGNYINNNDAEAVFYELSYNGQITNNNIVANTVTKGRTLAAQGSTLPIGSIYLSESGGDSRVDGGKYSTFNIAGNNLVDNWGGVTLWEDANRFCGSDPNTSVCTVGGAASLSTCVAGTIDNPPYLADCRWKTQNVSVHDNQFGFSRTNVACTTTGCGEQAILATTGTAPSWSPYLGTVVKTGITTQQNNQFAHNTYTGDWQFAWSDTTPLSFTQWQGSPSNQDIGSTMNGVGSPPPPPGNLLDADTASMEGSIGHWAPWFSTMIAQSAAHAQAGTHSLQVNITAPFGWGVQLNNWPGFAATAGPQTISFWGLAGTGTLGATMQAQWRDASGTVLGTSNAALATLTPTWQQASAKVTAPSGTASVTVTFTGSGGGAGDSWYLDQVFVGTAPAAGVNALDADTASLEGSAGHWAPWFSTTVARTTAQAEAGTHSLQVNITAPFGWGVTLDNWPGFATTPGPRTIRFWGLAGAGTPGVTMQVQWRDGSGNALATNSASIATLSGTWQQATAAAVAPAGTVSVTVTFTGTAGAGTSLYLDEIYVGT